VGETGGGEEGDLMAAQDQVHGVDSEFGGQILALEWLRE
jgi:hypothetical protein